MRRIEWLSATHATGKSRQWHKGFRIGAVQTIVERLSAANEDVVDEESQTALVRVDRAISAHEKALEAFVSARMRLKKGRGVRIDMGAYDSGRAAGQTIVLPS